MSKLHFRWKHFCVRHRGGRDGCCFDFPAAIRASIYSTNLIESFNKKFKRQTKKREQFPNEESLERTLMTVILDYNDKFDQRVHKGFNMVEDTLESMF